MQILIAMTLFLCIILAYYYNLAQEPVQQKLGKPCYLDNNTRGTCIKYSDCVSAQNALKQQNIQPTSCNMGFLDGEQIICCDKTINVNMVNVYTAVYKCEQYSEFGYKDSGGMAVMIGAELHKIPVFVPNDETMITGGELAEEKEFPHMALVGYKKEAKENITWYCGGSLISEQFVLTAAHCLLPEAQSIPPPSYVRLGSLSKSTPASARNVQQYLIKVNLVHPDYKGFIHTNDIGLIELTEKVTFTENVRPACLNARSELEQDDLVLLATGWGIQNMTNRAESNELRKTHLKVVSHEECSRQYAKHGGARTKNGINKYSTFCAGDPIEGKNSTCSGDSGGPLQLQHPIHKSTYNIVGVTSLGIGCETKRPGIYTRVSHYVDWIQRVVWPKDVQNQGDIPKIYQNKNKTGSLKKQYEFNKHEEL